MKVNRWLKQREKYVDDINAQRDQRLASDKDFQPTTPPSPPTNPVNAPDVGPDGKGWMSPFLIVATILGSMGVLVLLGMVVVILSPIFFFGFGGGGGYGGSGGVAPAVSITPPTQAMQVVATTQPSGYIAVDLTTAAQHAQTVGVSQIPTQFGHTSASVVSHPAITPPYAQGAGTVFHQSQTLIQLPNAAVGKGKVYVGSGFTDYTLHAFDTSTGQPVWTTRFSDNGPGTAFFQNDCVIVNTESCSLYVLDADTGRTKWAHWLSDPVIGRPAAGQGIVVTTYPVNGFAPMQLQGAAPARSTYQPSHVLAAFDLQTGAVRWQRWVDGESNGPPTITPKGVYLATYSGTRYGFDLATGDLQFAVHDRTTSRPTVVDGQMVFTARLDAPTGTAEALCVAPLTNPTRARIIHTQPNAIYITETFQQKVTQANAQIQSAEAAAGWGSGNYGSPSWALAGEIVGVTSLVGLQSFEGSRAVVGTNHIAATMGDTLVCVDRKSLGQNTSPAWSMNLGHGVPNEQLVAGGWLAGPPVFEGDSLHLATADGNLITLDASQGGMKLADQHLGIAMVASPVLDGNKAYVMTKDGKAVSIPLPAGSNQAP